MVLYRITKYFKVLPLHFINIQQHQLFKINSKSFRMRDKFSTRQTGYLIFPKDFSLAKVAKAQVKMGRHIGPFAGDLHIRSRIQSIGPQCKSMDKNVFDNSLQRLRDLGV